MARLTWSLRSQQDLIEIGRYIAKDSALYAVNLIERVVACSRAFRDRRYSGESSRSTGAKICENSSWAATDSCTRCAEMTWW